MSVTMARGLLTSFAILAAAGRALAADATEAELERRFATTVRPFVEKYCISCHAGERPAAQFDLRRYNDLKTIVEDYRHWALVRDKLSAGQMPPKSLPQPAPEVRNQVTDWIAAMLKDTAQRNAGDPGMVLARRLSNAEYNYTIRDLTGVDLKPTREFPVDPANPSGFDNSGESLAMSPALMTKYLQAARDVANHMVLKPDGIAFAPHLVLVETDRDKYCAARIIELYQRHNTDYAAYFQAAWQFKHRVALGKPRATLADLAAANKVSPKYLATVWQALEQTKEEVGPLGKLQSMWRELPAPKAGEPAAAKTATERMRDYVVGLRKKIELRFPDLAVQGINRTAQPFLIWRNRQYATHRRDFDRAALEVAGEARRQVADKPAATETDNADEAPVPSQPMIRQPGDPDLQVPAGERPRYEAAFARFASVFPDAFYISERGRYFPDNTRDKGRHLSAGFHNLMGYFRDDQPFYELILEEKEQRELDALWRELDFIAGANIRTYTQFYLFETREASKATDGGIVADDKGITSEPRIKKVEESYLARARAANNPTAIRAIEEFFSWTNAGIRWVEKARTEAEHKHLDALLAFAARAYRRPLTETEKADLLGYYRSLREKDGLTHEDAVRDSVVSVLVSPDFCYRIDLVNASSVGARNTAAAKPQASPAASRPLPDYALASRLSYFLWSSMPDEELLAGAAAGDLHQPAVMVGQARRMLKDPRALGLATEFGGNWLDFRRFEEHNAVDRERFPAFTNELRRAMFEEPARFIERVIRNDRSVLDLLFGRYTVVNPVLAKHYGIPAPAAEPDEWVQIDDARQYGRGGLLPMSAFLTKNAPGLRTSPVKRGYWIVKRVLGEEIPPPPAVVPELPRDESKLELPLREMLAKHREEPSCASCHARFDSFGLAFEGYGPVGEKRTQDLAGRPVDTRAAFPGGAEGDGLEGVLAYIQAKRQKDFTGNLCRKLTSYALGRGLILSDEPLIEQMGAKLAADRYRFSSIVESIVASPQFLRKRGPEVAP